MVGRLIFVLGCNLILEVLLVVSNICFRFFHLHTISKRQVIQLILPATPKKHIHVELFTCFCSLESSLTWHNQVGHPQLDFRDFPPRNGVPKYVPQDALIEVREGLFLCVCLFKTRWGWFV